MVGHAVRHRAHPVLAHAEVEVPPRGRGPGEIAHVLEVRVVRGREVRGAAHEARHGLRDRVEHLAASRPGGERFPRLERGERDRRQIRRSAGEGAVPLGGEAGILAAPGIEGGLPLLVPPAPRLAAGGEVRAGFGRDVECRVLGNAERPLRRLHLLGAERCAVRLGGARRVRGALRDGRLEEDERRTVGGLPGLGHHAEDSLRVVHAAREGAPAEGLVALQHVLGEGEFGRALDGDPVRVVEDDQLPEAEVPGQRRRLVADAFHHVAVTGQDERVVVDHRVLRRVEPCREHPLGDRHAHGVAEALSQGARRGLDAGSDAPLGVPGGFRVELPEALQVVEADVVAGQVQQRVEEQAPVTGRQHEPVPVDPPRVRRVVLQDLAVEQRAQLRAPHGQARVPGLGLLDRIHGEAAYRGGDRRDVSRRHESLPEGGADTDVRGSARLW